MAPEAIRSAFDRFDRNRSGAIEVRELGNVLRELGYQSDDATAAEARVPPLFDLLAEEVLLIVLGHACTHMPTLLAALVTCSRWRRLLRSSQAMRRIDVREAAVELRSGLLSLPRLLALPADGPTALCLSHCTGLSTAAFEQALRSCSSLRALDVSGCSLSRGVVASGAASIVPSRSE